MGTFDGLHIGHLHVLEQLKKMATEVGGESVILTFWPHPKMVLSDKKINLLNAFEEKIGLFEQAGIDHLVVLDFTKELAAIGYEEFVSDILISKIGMKHLIFGYDHRFGRNGEGTFEKLKPLTKQYRFKLHQLSEIRLGHAISSTRIRHALEGGRVSEANKMLGYNYKLTGTVVHGEQLGRKLGFATANIDVTCSYKLIPKHGVYACKAIINNKCYPAMMNIGTKPTVKSDSRESIEVHIIDFEQNIYGKTISVEVLDKLRDEQKFSSLKALKEQLDNDKAATLLRFSDMNY